jgi:DNA-binding IclR family transcriptional regulator
VTGATSNPTRRVVDVLNFLARKPNRVFSLSELSRELGISKSTLHPLVETLTDSGYLMRDNATRMIRLGPVLTGVGAAALGHRGHLVDSLRPVLEHIAHDLDAHCLVSAVFGDWIVPVAAAGEPSRVTTLFRIGSRANPFAPPMGVLFLPGRPMAEVQDWLDRAQPAMEPAEVELHLSTLDLLRTTGVAAAARLDVKARIEHALDEVAATGNERNTGLPELMQELRLGHYLVTDFADPTPLAVDWIGIPLCDERGRADSAMVVLNLPRAQSGPEILQIGKRMMAAASAVPGVRLLSSTNGRKAPRAAAAR